MFSSQLLFFAYFWLRFSILLTILIYWSQRKFYYREVREMAKDELQQHLDKGRFGAARINPDEQRKYLGTFRERCFASMTVREMKNQQDQKNLITEIKKYPEGKLLINGAVDEKVQADFIALASKNSVDFTIVMMRQLNQKIVSGYYWLQTMLSMKRLLTLKKNILQLIQIAKSLRRKRKAFLVVYLIKEN